MPCAIKKMKGRLTKEQVSLFFLGEKIKKDMAKKSELEIEDEGPPH